MTSSSSHSLKPSQQRTLLAWYQALDKVNPDSFSDSLTQKIQHIQTELSQDNYQIIAEIPTTVKLNPDLHQAYETAREQLTEAYSSQEKDKFILTSVEEKSTTEAKELSILKALDIRSLTIENLMYRLNLPEDQVIEAIEKLWNEGKIANASGSLLGKFIPRFRNKKKKLDDYFTLTFKGRLQVKSLLKEN
jgi:hypothetical protein